MWWPLALSIFMLVSTGHGQNLATKICPMDMVYTDIGTNANAIIGGLYEMRQPGTKGFGCGPVITGKISESLLIFYFFDSQQKCIEVAD